MSTRTNESKQRILLTAIDLIKEKGYDSVTINDICTAANISKTTFYYYFESKEDLMLQFYRIPKDIITRNLASILMEETNIEQYWKLIEPMIDFIEDSGTEIIKHLFCVLISKNIPAFSPPTFQQDIFDIGIKIIEKAQASGEIGNTTDPAHLMAVTQTQFVGVVSAWCTSNGKFDFKNAVRFTIEACFDVKPELRKAADDTFVKFNLE